jgi:NADH dehydrogenase FAD-containing subunit
MNLRQIKTNQNRFIEQYKSFLATRNTIIISFENEFNRHVKLIFGNLINKTNIKLIQDKYEREEREVTPSEAVKEIINGYPSNHELRISLKASLKKSRNMKKIQAEMVEIKTRIKEVQIECKNYKRLYSATQSALSDKGITSIKDTTEYIKTIRMVEKFEKRNKQRAKQ